MGAAGEVVVARCDRAEVLKAAEHTVDGVGVVVFVTGQGRAVRHPLQESFAAVQWANLPTSQHKDDPATSPVDQGMVFSVRPPRPFSWLPTTKATGVLGARKWHH